MVNQYSLVRSGFEVYKTKEESIEPITFTVGSKSTDDNSDYENDDGFRLLNGEIQEIDYYGNMYANSFDEDYEDISSGGTVTFPEVDPYKIYKGKKICLKKEWESPNKPITWDDLKTCLLGFITEQTYSHDKVELKLVGMHKLMEQEANFDFKSMKRSEIVRAIIEESGLKAEIDVSGLIDDVMDYSNSSSEDSDDSSTYSGNVSSDVVEMAKKVCKGKKTDEAKATAIHKFIQSHVQYPTPNYSDHQKCPSQVLSSGISNCCDRARLGYEMAQVVNLTARGVHGPNHVWVQYKINGKWVDSDPGVSRPNLGSVYQGMSMNRVWNFPSC